MASLEEVSLSGEEEEVEAGIVCHSDIVGEDGTIPYMDTVTEDETVRYRDTVADDGTARYSDIVVIEDGTIPYVDTVSEDGTSPHSNTVTEDGTVAHSNTDGTVPHSYTVSEDGTVPHSSTVGEDSTASHSNTVAEDGSASHSNTVAEDGTVPHSSTVAEDSIASHSNTVAENDSVSQSNSVAAGVRGRLPPVVVEVVRLPSLFRAPPKNEEICDASSSIHTSDEEEEPGGDDYTSWDDTICSNRSAYFKMYYSQRGIIGGNREESKSKALQPSSHNSLSSLIQEKMGKPNTPATKTRAEIGLMVLVVLLFVTIVLGISLTTYFYNLHLLELSIFNCIKFYESPRILEIYNAEWKPLTTVHLGSSLPPNSIPEDCTNYLHYLKRHNYTMPHKRPDDDDYEDMVCLDWTGLAQLQLRKLYAQGDVQCYSVWWGAANEEFKLRDCLKADKEHGVWWGGGEMSEGGFPVTNANIAPERMVTGKLGRDSWGQLLRHTWLSDRASLLTLPESFSGQVSINYENDGQVCLETGPYPSLIAPLPTMEYHLCTAPNVTSLIYFMHQEAVNKRKIVVEASSSLVTHKSYVEENQNTEAPLGHPKAVGHMNVSRKPRKILKEIFKKEVKDRVQERLEHPVWVPWMPPDRPQLTQEAVIEYVESILSKKYGLQGHVLLPPSWQGEPGELEFDPDRFPDPALLAQTLKDKGFHLALTIHPFVSVGASAFNSGTRENLWVRQKNSSLPALTNYDESHPSVVTDFSNPRGTKWFTSRLQHLQKSYKIDRFHLQPADAHALPVFHEYHMPLPGPDSILVYFMASVSAVSPPVSTEGTVTTPMPPTFLTLGTADGSWRGLGTLVPRVLTLAMLGYSLVDVGPIGGIARHGHVPERELYIRWLQVATFLPAMQISVLPHMYDKEVVNLVTEYIEIRKTMVLPRLLQNVSDALELGTPLIHPLALFDPNDTEAAKVHDEWILGEDLLIAPVTERGKRNRNIYLPTGIWKDEIDGNLRRGGRWLKDYKVPLTKTPHFTLKSVEGNAR
ncbi:myogenesis-regulating glycosidase-like isoform X3 [Procambarus clarkii]|uniref:myogenesis-regulating glycosidase-like isoform X3 n=1 Tax=Procambarus clarkii TaxID=6728 RepID=UPI00374267FC